MPIALRKNFKNKLLILGTTVIIFLVIPAMFILSLTPMVSDKRVTPETLDRIEKLIADYRLKIWKKSPPYQFQYNQSDIDTFIDIFNSTHKEINISVTLEKKQFQAVVSYQFSFLGYPIFINLKGKGIFEIDRKEMTITPNSLQVGSIQIPSFFYHSALALVARYHSDLGLPIPFIEDINHIKLRKNLLHIKLNRSLSAGDILRFAPQKKIRISPNEKRFIQQVVFQILLILKDEPAETDLFKKLVSFSFQTTDRLGKDKYDTLTLNKLSVLSMGLFYRIPIISEKIGIDDELDQLFQVANVKLYKYKIFRRKDWAKHFVYSAVLTTLLGEEITKRIGAVKEIRDFKFSGFSFSDLLADRAGAIFAKQLLSTPENGAILRRKILSGFQVEDFFPNKQDLPDNMKRTEFEEQFKSAESEQYQKIMKEINHQIYQSYAYQDLPKK